MKIEISDIKSLLKQIAQKYVSEDEAIYYSDELVEAYIRKYPRTNIFKDEVISDTERQEKFRDYKMEIQVDLPSLLKINFNHLPITFKLKWIHDTLIEKAQKTGISILAFDNSGGMHTLHTWTQGLAKRGFFAIGSYNGGPCAVVPYGGTRGLLGTNPMTYAFPTEDGIVVVDMATSEIPFFEVFNAKKNNNKLKENVAVDNDGHITTDPQKALHENGISNLLPMGGNYKGYAVNYLLEIMTSSLIGAKLSDMMDLSYVNEDHGGFLMVVNIEAFTKVDDFKKEVSRFNNVIREQKGVDNQKVIVPGDRNQNRYEQIMKEGKIDIDDDIYSKLVELSK